MTEQDSVSTMQKNGWTIHSSFLVLSDLEKGLTWMWSLVGRQQPFSCVLGHFWRGDKRTNKQPGDPSASLLLTGEKNTFYHKMTGDVKTSDDPAHL